MTDETKVLVGHIRPTEDGWEWIVLPEGENPNLWHVWAQTHTRRGARAEVKRRVRQLRRGQRHAHETMRFEL